MQQQQQEALQHALQAARSLPDGEKEGSAGLLPPLHLWQRPPPPHLQRLMPEARRRSRVGACLFGWFITVDARLFGWVITVGARLFGWVITVGACLFECGCGWFSTVWMCGCGYVSN